MLSPMMWSMVREWKAVLSRTVWISLQCGNEKSVIVNTHGPGNEKKGRSVRTVLGDTE
jgi:hypothetical protein